MRLLSTFACLSATLRAFRRDRKANVAMMFGLSLMPLLVATSVGIDFARGVMVHQRMEAALDAAALAVGNSTTKPATCPSAANQTACTQLQNLAQTYFSQNYDIKANASYGTPGPVSISIANQTVTLSATLPLQLTLLGTTALNVGQPNVTASSTVVWGQTKLWVALVLDNSGSMANGDSGGSKMAALQDAIINSSYGLLGILKAAAANDGDVQVGIVPFTRSVNMGKSTYTTSPGYNYIDWGEWEAPPANIDSSIITPSVGAGSTCPFSTGNQGFACLTSSSNSASTTRTVPSSGLICPGQDNGAFNQNHNARYYNGCWTSVGTTTTTTTDVSTPTTVTQSCSQTGSKSASCSQTSSKTGNAKTTSTTSTAATPANYGGDGTTTNTTSSSNTTDGTQSCSGKGSNQKCTWTRTIVTTSVKETVTTATTYAHAWTPNAHSTWSGCVMDRQRKNNSTTVTASTGFAGVRASPNIDYDETNTQPNSSTSAWDDTQFPAENPASCPAATVTTLNYNWTTLASQVDAMVANGSTNQSIGVEHGWQMLTTGAPYATGALPSGTTKVLILFSDGLNTQDRWYGDGGTEGTTQDGYIDARESAACSAARADNVMIYAIFIHIGTNGSSSALLDCAGGDTTKYYDLTASSQIKTAFSDIAQKITNLRVSQ